MESFGSEGREDRHDHAIDAVRLLEARCGHQTALHQLIGFMIDYVSLMLPALPQEAKEWFLIARDNCEARQWNESLEKVRDAAWRYLSALKGANDFSNAENCAVRAVLCLIQREPPIIDLADTCLWFLLFADQVEDHSLEIARLVEKYFGATGRDM